MKNYELIETLVNARKASNVTQQQIADHLKVTRQMISAFENGLNTSGRILMYYIQMFGGDLHGQEVHKEA